MLGQVILNVISTLNSVFLSMNNGPYSRQWPYSVDIVLVLKFIFKADDDDTKLTVNICSVSGTAVRIYHDLLL